MAVESSWWPLSPWLSPGAAWFLLFNVIVGAVAVLSWRQNGQAPPSRCRRLTRSASSMVMERLRSVSMFAFQCAAEDGSFPSPASPQLHHAQEYCTPQENEAEVKSAEEASRTSTMAPPSSPVATAAAAHAAAWASGSDGAEEETGEGKSVSLEEACAEAAARPDRAPAPQPSPAAAAAAEPSATVERREPAKVVGEFKQRAYAEFEVRAHVNARAEMFIRQFREDLKLERLNSIRNHGRCAAAAPAR